MLVYRVMKYIQDLNENDWDNGNWLFQIVKDFATHILWPTFWICIVVSLNMYIVQMILWVFTTVQWRLPRREIGQHLENNGKIESDRNDLKIEVNIFFFWGWIRFYFEPKYSIFNLTNIRNSTWDRSDPFQMTKKFSKLFTEKCWIDNLINNILFRG